MSSASSDSIGAGQRCLGKTIFVVIVVLVVVIEIDILVVVILVGIPVDRVHA
jgi:hypothetical protein